MLVTVSSLCLLSGPQVCDPHPSLCSPIKEPFSPLNNVVSTEPFRGCYVRAQPFDEFPSSNRRYLPPQVSCKLRPFRLAHPPLICTCFGLRDQSRKMGSFTPCLDC